MDLFLHHCQGGNWICERDTQLCWFQSQTLTALYSPFTPSRPQYNPSHVPILIHVRYGMKCTHERFCADSTFLVSENVWMILHLNSWSEIGKDVSIGYAVVISRYPNLCHHIRTYLPRLDTLISSVLPSNSLLSWLRTATFRQWTWTLVYLKCITFKKTDFLSPIPICEFCGSVLFLRSRFKYEYIYKS